MLAGEFSSKMQETKMDENSNTKDIFKMALLVGAVCLVGPILWRQFFPKEVVTLVVPAGQEHEYKENAKAYERVSGKKFNIVTADSVFPAESAVSAEQIHADDILKKIDELELQLEVDSDQFGQSSPKVARVRVEMGLQWLFLKEYDKSLEQFALARQIFIDNFGERDPNTKEVERFLQSVEQKKRKNRE